MSLNYKAVGWNRQKKIYDKVLVAGVAIFIAMFVGASALLHPDATAETLLIRGFGTAAMALLFVPGLNLVLLPLASVGGTLAYCDLKRAGRAD